MSEISIPFGFNPQQWFVILIVAMGIGLATIVTLAGIVSNVLNSIHRRNIEHRLKQDMLDRGMSAEEIVKVIEATPPSENAAERWMSSWCKK